jgi:hypothetical protein
MAATEPPTGGPTFDVKIDAGTVTGEVTGIRVDTLVSVYVFGAPGAVPRPPRSRDAEPYKFLDSYTFADQDIFFGREALAQRIGAVVRARETTALIGKAAVGKTSLIHAGLVPLLSRDGAVAAFAVRDYAAPVAAVRAALGQIPDLALKLPADDSLSALLASFLLQTNRQVVLFFDQFERLFATPPAQQEAFARDIVAAQRQDDTGRLHLVFVLREEYRAATADLQTRVRDANFLSNVQLIPDLTLDEARAAILRPLRVADGVDRAVFEDGLIEARILPQLDQLDASSDGRISPAPLQIVCSRLYARAQAAVAGSGRQATISLDLYKQLGQAQGILRSYLSDQRGALGVSDDEWLLMRRLLRQMAESDTLQFYALPDLAAAVAKPQAQVLRLLQRLQQARLVEGRDAAAFALSANTMVAEIRTWFQDELNQERGTAALARALADWDDQRLLTEPRRLQRIRGALAFLKLEPRALALLLRSAVAYEADPKFWLTQAMNDARTRAALAKLERGDDADPVVGDLADVLGLREQGAFDTLGQAAVLSPVTNVRVASSLALSTLGAASVIDALQPYLSARALRRRLSAIMALAWMRFVGVPWRWPPLAVGPLVALVMLTLRLRANRVKIASVAASAFVGTILAGVPAALVPLLAAGLLGVPVRNPTLEFVILLGVEIAIGGIAGVSYAVADVIAPPTRPKAPILLRPLAIVVGFALANAFVVRAQTAGSLFDLRPLFIGAVMGIGFGVANEWALRRFREDEVKRVLLSAAMLAFSTGLATALTIVIVGAFRLQLITTDSIPWRVAGGVNPIILLNFPDGILQLIYVAINAFIGGIIGFGLAGGLVVGDHLAAQLERARYV